MTSTALIAWLVLAQLPLSTQVELPSGKVINLAADYADTLGGGQKVSARGNVELSSGDMVVRADELVYDAATGKVTAKGNVRFFSFPYVGVADEVSVDIEGREAILTGALFMKKRGVTKEQLLAARSIEELKAMGDSQLSVSGTRIKQLAEDTFEVENLSFTPCDCDANSITWRVEARKANVQVGERATLTFPVVYVKSIPVFAFPWLYLPVTERRSGLLVPRPAFTPQSGFAIDAPVFVTLGESYDMTLTPGYYFGNQTPVRPDGSLSDGIEGPRLQTEFRYVPSTRTTGRATLGLIYDLRGRRDPVNNQPALYDGANPPRGLRGEGSLAHDQDLGNGWRDRVDASLVSDGFYTRDLNADIIAREVPYIRSTAAVYRRTDDYWTGLDVILRQDLRYGYSMFRQDRDASGAVVRGAGTMQRLPGLTFAVPQRPIAGPLNAGFTASYVRISPIIINTGDEGVDGIFDPRVVVPGDGQADRLFQAGEREARMRLDINPRVSAELNASRFLTLTPYAALRQDVYYGEASGQLSQRGYATAGATVSTELSRVYDWKVFQFRHALAPLAEVRYVPAVWGAVPGASYDEVDAAVAGRFLQGVVELQQQLQRRSGAEHLEVVRFDIGQGFDLFEQRPTDAFARFSFGSGPVRLTALSRYDVQYERMAQLSASATIDDGRGDAAYVSYDRLRLSGTDRTRRGIDALVGPGDYTTDFAEQLTAGLRVNFSMGLSARYEAVVAPQQRNNDADPALIRQQVFGLGYGPACDCWRLEGQAVVRPNVPIQGGLNFSISRFGSFGTGG